MHRCLVTAVLAAVPAISVAQLHPLDFGSISFPSGWSVSAVSGGYMVTPASPNADQEITVQACTRSKADCGKSCSPSELRPNYFYFFDAKSNAEYRCLERPDGYQALMGVGTFGTSPTWIAATVMCGPAGVIYIGVTSGSKEDAASLLSEISSSVHLSGPDRATQEQPLPSIPQ